MYKIFIPLIIIGGFLYLIKPYHELIIINSASDAACIAAYSLADESVLPIPKPTPSPSPVPPKPRPHIFPLRGEEAPEEAPEPVQPPSVTCKDGKCQIQNYQPRFRLFR